MEFDEIWKIVWRRKLIIAQACLVILLTTMIGSFLLTPVYETSAKIIIEDSGAESSILESFGLATIDQTKSSDTEMLINNNMEIEMSTLWIN